MENKEVTAERNFALSLKIEKSAYDQYFKPYKDNPNFFISVTQEGKDGTNSKGITTHKFKSNKMLKDAVLVDNDSNYLLQSLAEMEYRFAEEKETQFFILLIGENKKPFAQGKGKFTNPKFAPSTNPGNSSQDQLNLEIDLTPPDNSQKKLGKIVLSEKEAEPKQVLRFKFKITQHSLSGVQLTPNNKLLTLLRDNKTINPSITANRAELTKLEELQELIYQRIDENKQIKLEESIENYVLIPNVLAEKVDSEYLLQFFIVNQNNKLEEIGRYCGKLSLKELMVNGQSLKLMLDGQNVGEISDFHNFPNKFFKELLDFKTGRNVEFQLTLAIDFTLSNKIRGLHSPMSKSKKSVYQMVIEDLGANLYKIDEDKKITCWGFGGYREGYPEQSSIEPFNLSGDPKQSEAEDVEQVIKWYKDSLQNTAMGSPTDFSGILKKLNEQHKERVKKNSTKTIFSILLIITDGVVEGKELTDTIKQLAECCKNKMSIIIIGVGDSDFSNMRYLDGDAAENIDKLKKAKVFRDIVQFVEYRSDMSSSELVNKVVEELPKHIEEALGNNNIK